MKVKIFLTNGSAIVGDPVDAYAYLNGKTFPLDVGGVLIVENPVDVTGKIDTKRMSYFYAFADKVLGYGPVEE